MITKLSQTCNKTHKVSHTALCFFFQRKEIKFCPLNISFVSAGIDTEPQ